jgi:pimeloyl-ACP methyl ester carboxylesterase
MLHHLPPIAERLMLRMLHLKGYRSTFIRTSVGRIHVLDARGRGSLPPVLVLHGLSAAGQHYENLLSLLRPHVRRVIAVDMPGHGESELPTQGMSQRAVAAGLKEGLDAALDEPAVIFGNSLGGAAAVRYAAEHPEKVLGLVLAAPGGAPMKSEELEEFVGHFILDNHTKALDFVDKLFHRPHRFRHLLAWGVRHQFRRPGVAQLLSGLETADLLRPEELEKLTMPTLVLWGERDRVLRPAHREFFEAHLPAGAVVERLARYGHVPHMENPRGLAARILAHVRKSAEHREAA